MKILFILVFILILPTANADFIEAQKNYDQGKYTQAFDEFYKLAKLGNEKSQYNVAVMLSKGQGVEKNLVEAFAWSKLVSNIKYKNLKELLENSLSENERAQSDLLFTTVIADYAFEKSKVLLGPVTVNKARKGNSSLFIKIDKQVAPSYPRQMAMSGFQGWVKLIFNVYPDNSVRDIQVVENFPNNGFNKEAIKSIERMQFHFENNGELIKLKEPYAVSQRIDFKLRGKPQGLSVKQKHYLSKLENKAKQGDVISQYQYATIQDRYLQAKDVDQKQMNQWLFNASQEGIADAQYRLGKNIFYGKACKTEKQKGLDWIMHAAQMGNPYAQYMAYQMLQSKKVINPSNESSFYWLQQAAKNGLSIAQLNIAKEIALKTNPTPKQIKLAKSYIKNYAKEVHKTIQWYQISALLDGKAKNYSRALSKIKSAIKLAKMYGWDTVEFEQQKSMFQQNKV